MSSSCRVVSESENLPAVTGTHDPRRPVHVGAHVSLVRDERLTRVDADPHSHRPSFERGLTVSGRGHRIGGACEGVEEGVALGVHLDAAVPRERISELPPVLGEHIRVALTELVQQSCRPLDVGEEKRHRSARKSLHAAIIPQRRPKAKSTMSAPATAHRR